MKRPQPKHCDAASQDTNMQQIWPARHLQSPLSEVAACEKSAERDASDPAGLMLLIKARDGRVAALEARRKGMGRCGNARTRCQAGRS